VPNSTDPKNIFPAGVIERRFPDASHPENLAKILFFSPFPDFSGSSLS